MTDLFDPPTPAIDRLPGGPWDEDRSLYGPRVEEWGADILDRTDQIKTPLRVFSGGHIEQNRDRAVRGGGTVSMKWKQGEEPNIDWSSDRIGLYYVVNGQRWPMGVFLVSVPVLDYDDDTNTVTAEVSIMDKLTVLDQDLLDGSYSLPADTPVVPAVRSVIASTGETAVTITDDDRTTLSGMTWEAGTSKLQVVNDLLGAINFEGVWVDPTGVYRSGPYRAPDRRPVRATLREGRDSVHVAQWSRAQDWYDTPNKVVLITQGGEEMGDGSPPEPSLRSIRTNENPDSPYSYQRRGRWIVHTETGVEVADQESLDNLATMRLGQLSSRVANLTVVHAMMNFQIDDRLTLVTRNHTVDVWVRTWSVDMHPGSLVTGGWREVTFL